MADLKRWIQLDLLIKREEERKLEQGTISKKRNVYEFKYEDWLDMLQLLPDIADELDHEINTVKNKNKQLKQMNEDLNKKVTSVDNQVFIVQRSQEQKRQREEKKNKKSTTRSSEMSPNAS